MSSPVCIHDVWSHFMAIPKVPIRAKSHFVLSEERSVPMMTVVAFLCSCKWIPTMNCSSNKGHTGLRSTILSHKFTLLHMGFHFFMALQRKFEKFLCEPNRRMSPVCPLFELQFIVSICSYRGKQQQSSLAQISPPTARNDFSL